MVDILLLGATGFTGRLAVRYLYNHQRRRRSSSSQSDTPTGFSFAIAGRSTANLNELVMSLGLDSDVKAIVLDVLNEAEVENAVKQARVVMNFIGPYWKFGWNVVKACAANGVHYVDVSGEPHFTYDVRRRYDYLAYKNNSIIVPSCAFSALVSDVLVYVSARTMIEVLTSPLESSAKRIPSANVISSKTSFKLNAPGPSGGSLRTLMSTIEDVPKDISKEVRCLDVLSPVKKPMSISNSPSLVYTLSQNSLTNILAAITDSSGMKNPFTRWGSFSLVSPFNRGVVMLSWGLLERVRESHHDATVDHSASPDRTENSHTKGDCSVISYGPDFVYDEFIHAEGPIRALVTSLLYLSLLLAMTILPPMRWLVKKLAPKSGEGPSEEEMLKARLFATNITSAMDTHSGSRATQNTRVVKTTLEINSDPGYTGSAIMASEAALALLDVPALPWTAQHGGVLTPATALGDVIVSKLSDSGFWEVKSDVVV